jgi:hypothetical protein
MEYFKRRNMDGLMWGSILARAVFLASINVSMVIIMLMQIIWPVLFKMNVLDVPYSEFKGIAIGILNAFLLDYIYMNKKKYEYITSSRYRPFKSSINAGVAISYLTSIVLFIITGFLAVGADKFLKK